MEDYWVLLGDEWKVFFSFLMYSVLVFPKILLW